MTCGGGVGRARIPDVSQAGVGLRCADIEASARFYDGILGAADLVYEDDPEQPHFWGGLGKRLMLSLMTAEAPDRVTRNLDICVEVPCVVTVMGRLEEWGIPNSLTVNGTLATVDPDGNRVVVVEVRRVRQERREWEPGFGES